MKKVRTSSAMSSGVRKSNTRVSSVDTSKKSTKKNPLLGKPVEDDDDIMIKF